MSLVQLTFLLQTQSHSLTQHTLQTLKTGCYTRLVGWITAKVVSAYKITHFVEYDRTFLKHRGLADSPMISRGCFSPFSTAIMASYLESMLFMFIFLLTPFPPNADFVLGAVLTDLAIPPDWPGPSPDCSVRLLCEETWRRMDFCVAATDLAIPRADRVLHQIAQWY